MAVVAAEDATTGRGGSDSGTLLIVFGVLTVFTVVIGTVRYLVTRWTLDGTTLRIETGLFKRDARQFPVARIQAVDVIKPFLARLVGLAELRIRVAGSGRAGGRLSYLSEPVALDLRARLLAGHHGIDQSTPEPAERPMATVSTGQLVASAVLSAVTGWAVGLVAILVVLLATSSAAGPTTAGAGTLFISLIGFARNTWRRVAEQYGFSVALAPDGIRVRRGLLSTVSETIPFARVQAVRKIEPLWWRPFGWCRLEVDVAGSPGDEHGTRSSRVTKSLLPVGRREVADALFSSLLGLRQFPLSRPPHRARWKAPLSYHFLAAGYEGGVVAATTGRLKKVTIWLPLEKVQSVRRVQGPVQRAFNLATVYVDAAGRRAQADIRDRDVHEADKLFQQLVLDSREARRKATARSAPAPKPVPLLAALGGPLPPTGPEPNGGQRETGVGQPLPPPPPPATTSAEPHRQ